MVIKSGYIKNVLFFLMMSVAVNYGHTADLTEDYLKSRPTGNALDKKRWEKLKDDYRYKSVKIDSTTKKDVNIPQSVFGNAGWFKVFVWLAIFLLAGLIIYLLARLGFLDNILRKKPVLFDIHSEPDDLNDLDIDPLLDEALKNKDYKLATRLKFLALLQVLHKGKWIEWRRNSTNRDYIIQLGKNDISNSFRQLCLIYELVWYGNYAVNEEQFIHVNEKFTEISASLKTKVYV